METEFREHIKCSKTDQTSNTAANKDNNKIKHNKSKGRLDKIRHETLESIGMKVNQPEFQRELQI